MKGFDSGHSFIYLLFWKLLSEVILLSKLHLGRTRSCVAGGRV